MLPPADATSQLAAYAADAGLSGNDLLPQAIPQNDGVENIIKFAFNMDLSAPASNVLSNTGTSGLPLVAVIEDSQNKKFQLKYIRRKNSGLTYTPMYSTTLDPQSYLPFYGTETVNDIDESFERVCVELPIDIADLCACFGIVKVDY